MPHHSVRRSLLTALLVFGVLLSTLPAVPHAQASGGHVAAGARTRLDSAGQATRPEGAVPAPIQGGPTPTIALSPGSGYAGQTVAVSGQGVATFPGVRVAWLTGESTRTAAVVERQPTNAYSASVTVPDDLPPGPAQICAAVTGSSQAAFACANFTVNEPPPGGVQGRLPDGGPASQGAALDASAASMNLYNSAGRVVASAPIGADGSFSLGSVRPGTYTTGISGTVKSIVDSGTITIAPAETSQLALLLSLFCRTARVSQVRADLSREVPPGSAFNFGTYVALGPSGSAVNEIFEADLQVRAGVTVDRVEFAIVRPDGQQSLIGASTQAPYRVSYNMSLLPPGISRLIVTPIVGGAPQRGCTAGRAINVIPDPMRDPLFRNGASTTWDILNRRYNFAGTLPDLGGRLPLVFPDPPPTLPLVGRIENRLDAGLRVEGTLELRGDIHLRIVRAYAQARLLSRDIFNGSRELLPPNGQVIVNPADLRQVGLGFGPHTLYSFNTADTQVFQGVIYSIAGIVNVKASISVGISGDLTIEGTLRPLLPAVDMRLTATVRPRLTVSIWLDLLLGVVKAGADVNTQVSLSLPLRINTQSQPPVWLENPCVRFGVRLNLWAAVNLWFWKKRWNLASWPLVDYATSSCPRMLAAATDPGTAAPRVMAAPSAASGPGGRALSVYVQDTTPTAEYPTPQIMARFWNAQTNAWDIGVPLTDGTSMVQDPVAAFVGDGGAAWVAWTQNSMTAAEIEANGDNLPGLLARQEIYAAYWDGKFWGTPQHLTTDSLPDGSATLAGDSQGVTLAWVRDSDGDIKTRTDWRIAARQWNAARQIWGAPVSLSAPTDGVSGVMNAQVSAARAAGRAALAWTADVDGELTTNTDRRLVVAEQNPQTGVWSITTPAGLPAGVESPSLAVDPQLGLRLAYLRRDKDGDGETETGIGNQATLWSASLSPTAAWQSSPVLGARGEPVRGEKPLLAINGTGEALLLFRRFGEPGTNGELGQLALTRATPGSPAFAAPLYLTDEARQHWQPALAINPSNGQALVLNVSRSPVANLADAPLLAQSLTRASPARAAARPMALTAADDNPVESLMVDPAADPALDAGLALSQLHAAPGSTVVVSATVRNLGRSDAAGLTVKLYSGAPGSGSELGSVSLPEALPFNGARSVSFLVRATGGEQPLYAEVQSGSGNASAANDRSTARLGALPAPSFLNAEPSANRRGALELSWVPPGVPGVAGYRILRGTTPGGPYELVGEAAGTTFTDLLLQPGASYRYVVQAYDAAGVLSERSAEAGGSVPTDPVYRLYMPQIAR